MQIKHTFLLTLILGMAWTGYLFAFSTGPQPAVNGVFGTTRTCAMAGCHSSSPLNEVGGSVEITGLPAEWVAGQTYALRVNVRRTGQSRFGFQVSAVFDFSNQQAGNFTPGGGQIIFCSSATGNPANCNAAGAIQFLEHSSPSTTGTFNFSWTAPSSISAAAIRFNVAGNAANGDSGDTGDFIYAAVRTVASSVTDDSTRPFAITDRSGFSVTTNGSGALSAGYSRIQAATGNTTPTGIAIFGFRQNNILVTEAGVPASPLLTAGRIYAEVNGPVNTGLAIANPNNQTANITFHFTNTAGVDFGTSSTAIPANRQIASFLNEAPYNGGASLQGTFSFTSDVPVSVIALRGFTNERGEFLITTLPVTDVSASTTADVSYLSQFADGGGWTTQIVLVNPTNTTITGSIQFFGQGTPTMAGLPLTLTASSQGGTLQTANSFQYTIPRQSSFRLLTSGTATGTTAGSVRVTPTGVAPSALVVFSFRQNAVTVSQAGVPAIKGSAFRIYVEATGSGTAVGTIQTGLAIANLSPASAMATLELMNLDGSSTGLVQTVTLPGNGQVAKFAHELFTLPFPFRGILRVSGGGPSGFSIVGLRGRYNERGEFLLTTTSPSNEDGTPTMAELLFPHLANGGGYTTQFILFSGTSGQVSSGNLRFFRQDGTPFNLPMN